MVIGLKISMSNKSLTSFKGALRGRGIDIDSLEEGYLKHLLYSGIALEVQKLKVELQAHKRARRKERKEELKNDAALQRIEDY